MPVYTTIPPSDVPVQTEHGITVTLFSEFLQHAPSDYFEVRLGHGHPSFLHDRQKLNLCTSTSTDSNKPKYFPDAIGQVIKAETLADLQDITQRLLTKPIYMDMKLESTEGDEPMKGKYMVTIWPQHPEIQPMLQILLKKAEQAMQCGKLFAIELDFKLPVSAWFSELVFGRVLYDSSGSIRDFCSSGSFLTITNTSEFEDCYKCDWPGTLYQWICCFPCCLLSFPCYRIHRCASTKDYRRKLDGNIDVAYLCLDPQQTVADITSDLIDKMRFEAKDGYKVQYAPMAHPTESDPAVIIIQPSAPLLAQDPYMPPSPQLTHHPYVQPGASGVHAPSPQLTHHPYVPPGGGSCEKMPYPQYPTSTQPLLTQHPYMPPGASDGVPVPYPQYPPNTEPPQLTHNPYVPPGGASGGVPYPQYPPNTHPAAEDPDEMAPPPSYEDIMQMKT